MKIEKTRVVAFGAAMLAFVGSTLAQAGIYEELTPAQQRLIQRGEQVFVTRDVSGSDWPKAYIYRRIDQVTSEEAFAFFTDYELQKTYAPSLKKSTIARRVDKRTTEVDYILGVPILRDEQYTTRTTISTYQAADLAYRADWVKVRATSARHIEGNVRFETLGTGTIMAYYNFVIPGASMAGMVKGRAMKQVQETAEKIAREVEAEKRNNPAKLADQVRILREALAP